jgi:ubiquinone/menaquinone biosynthesis C-methylase UbiE
MAEIDMSKMVAGFWKNFFPPIRPSTKFLQVYEEHIRRIKHRKDPKVLILGVTPELRMLGLRYNAKVTAIDMSSIWINAMEEFMDYTKVDKKRETIINCNWLDMALEKNCYDLILGDGSLNELKLKDYEILLIKLRHGLKPNGFISTKIQLPYSDGRDPTTMLDVFEDYKKKPEGKKTNLYSDLLMKLQCSKEAYDTKTYEFSCKRIFDHLTRLENQQKIDKKEFEALFKLFEFSAKLDYRASIPKRAELERMLGKYFSIISSTPDNKELFLDTRVYLLKHK